jgi:hypothetical protein
MASIIPSNAAQQCVQWTGGYAARFLSFFVALSFFRFNGESQPSHLPLTPAVSLLALAKIGKKIIARKSKCLNGKMILCLKR